MGCRVQKWDNVKFFLIVLVVVGHIADIYAEISPASGVIRFFIYTFHMPLFLFISGLFGKKHIKERNWKSIFSYLVLYLTIKVLIFVFKWIGYGTMPKFSLLSERSVPWYAFCLFSFSLISMFADKYNPKRVFVFAIVLSCVAGYDNSLGDKLCLMRTIVFFPFYYLGHILNPSDVKDFFDKKKIKILSIFILVASILILILFYEQINPIKLLFTGRNPYKVVFNNCPYAFLIRLICYAVSVLIGGSFIALVPSKIGNGRIAKIGANSIQIYALHYPVKFLYYGLINDRFHIEGYFTSKIVLYELLVSAGIIAICALPCWKKMFDKIMKG